MSILRIGTRGSELALAQTHQAIAALQAAVPGLECRIQIISTAGDQRTDIPLHQVNAATGTGDKGVFIAAIEEALAAGEIDCAVHSLKDMPGVLDARFELAAVLPREEIQDVLVVKTPMLLLYMTHFLLKMVTYQFLLRLTTCQGDILEMKSIRKEPMP